MALTKILLYITDDELVAFEWRDETIIDSHSFTRDGKGIVRYGAFLTENLEMPFSILLNTVEEEYRLETMAHIPKRQKVLLERHIQKQFRGITLKYGVIQGRETFGKKGYKLLLTAIGNDAFLLAWMQPLIDRKISISGINSLPLLTQNIMQRLNFKIERLLVVTRDGSILRLTYLDNNNFKISRSVKSDRTDLDGIVEEINAEIEKTLLYLGRIRLVFPDQKPEVVFISSYNICEKLKAKGNHDNPSIGKWTFCNNDFIRDSLGQHIDIMQDEYLIIDLFIHALYSSKNINHYATPSHKKFYYSRSLRRPLEIASAAFLVILSLVSAVLFIDSQVLDVRLQQLLEKTHVVESEYARGQARLPNYPISADLVKASVQAIDILLNDKPEIKKPLVALSRALANFSNVELSYMQWSVVQRDLINVEVEEEVQVAFSEDITEMADVEIDLDVAKRWVQVISIKGRLNNFNGNYVAANNSVEKLVRRLNEDIHFSSAVATKKPISSLKDEKINGATGRQANQSETAEFNLEIVINESKLS